MHCNRYGQRPRHAPLLLQQQTRLGWTHGRWTEDDVSLHLVRPRDCAGQGYVDGSCPQEKESVFYTSPLPNGQDVGVMAGAGAATVGHKMDIGKQTNKTERAWRYHIRLHYGAVICKRNPSHPCYSDLCYKNQTYILMVNSCQGCIFSSCLFNLYAEYIMRNAGLDEAQAGIKIAGRNINNLNMQMTPPLQQKVKKN